MTVALDAYQKELFAVVIRHAEAGEITAQEACAGLLIVAAAGAMKLGIAVDELHEMLDIVAEAAKELGRELAAEAKARS